jgi:hypothetical protein
MADELQQMQQAWQRLQGEREAVRGKALQFSLQLEPLAPQTLDQDLLVVWQQFANEVAGGGSGAAVAGRSAAGAGKGGERGGGDRGVSDEGDVKAACEVCYSPKAISDQERMHQCLLCSRSAGSDASSDRVWHDAPQAFPKDQPASNEEGGIGVGRRREQMWTGVTDAQSLDQQSEMKQMWEEQQRQQQQLVLQQTQWEQQQKNLQEQTVRDSLQVSCPRTRTALHALHAHQRGGGSRFHFVYSCFPGRRRGGIDKMRVRK